MTRRFAPVSALILAVLPCAESFGQEATAAHRVLLPSAKAVERLFDTATFDADRLPRNWRSHPLAPALQFATQRHAFIDEYVKDFSCVLAKRERINGRLRHYEYLRTNVRRQQQTAGRSAAFAVFAEFLAPKKLQGRRVLYVSGRNDDKMLVRNGGSHFGHVVVNVAPTSDAALRESRYPITELGLSNVVGRLIEQAQHDIVADPDARNTKVAFFRNAEIDGRVCTHIQVTHPTKDHVFDFHQANIYVDDQLHVPLRVETYTWPKDPGDPAVLVEEYTYMRLKLNVGLTDEDFVEARVRTP